MSKLVSGVLAEIRSYSEVLADDVEHILAEMQDAEAVRLVAARHAGAREAFNSMRNAIEIKAQEVSAERVDPEWLARMMGA